MHIKKIHIPYGLIIILVLFLFSCNKKQSFAQSDGYKSIQNIEPTQLNVIGHWLGEGKKEKLWKELLNEFQFTNQDVAINMKYAEDVYFDRRITNIEFIFNAKMVLEDKPEWDIIRLNNEYEKVSTILNDPAWAKKYLVDFSEIPEFQKTTQPELLSDTIKALYGGIIPGPFIDGYSWALWCNTEVAKKVGIEVKQFDMTFEDFLGYIKAVYDYNQQHNDSIYPIYEAGNWRTIQVIAEQLFFSEIGSYEEILHNEHFSEKKLAAWKKVLHDFERLAAYKAIPRNWRNITWTETKNYPLEGKCLFFSNASWMYNLWLKDDSAKTKNMMPTELPVYKPAPSYFGGYNATWAVLKKAPHREQAIRFLLFMNRPDVAEKWARYTKSPTGIKGNLTTYNFGLDKFETYQYVIDKKYGHHKIAKYDNSLFFFGEKNKDVENYNLQVISGEVSANKASAEIDKLLIRR